MPRYMNTLSDLEAYLRENNRGLRISYSGGEWFAYVAGGDDLVDSLGHSGAAFGTTMLEAVQSAVAEWEKG